MGSERRRGWAALVVALLALLAGAVACGGEEPRSEATPGVDDTPTSLDSTPFTMAAPSNRGSTTLPPSFFGEDSEGRTTTSTTTTTTTTIAYSADPDNPDLASDDPVCFAAQVALNTVEALDDRSTLDEVTFGAAAIADAFGRGADAIDGPEELRRQMRAIADAFAPVASAEGFVAAGSVLDGAATFDAEVARRC